MWASIRDYALLAVVVVGGADYDRRQRSGTSADDRSDEGSNVILVVSDGMRWQEVFRGADTALLFRGRGVMGADADHVRRRFWRATVGERRQALMPFLWGTVAREGQLFGNRDLGSAVRVTNGLNFSYPGYNELLTGYPDPRINRNNYGPNPNVTVFEWLHRRTEFRDRVAAVGAWDAFADIFNRSRSRIHMSTVRRHPLDRRSHATAMAILKDRKPRALFVAYVETDDWAHDGRYDLTLSAAHAVDSYLAELWATVQSDERYRGKTTLIFTADHGRGSTVRDWTGHGRDVRGADEIFLAMIGPGVPADGEARNTSEVTQSQIAATVAAVLGLDYRSAIPRAAEPVLAFVRR